MIEQVQIMSLKSRGGLTRGRGMTESVRQQWLYSTQACAAIHHAMPSITGKHHITTYSACGILRGKAILHDLRDLNKCFDWFGSHDPFDGNVPQLRSLSSGLAASEGDGIKCDETEKVVSEIQESFDSVSVRNATTKETSDGAHPE